MLVFIAVFHLCLAALPVVLPFRVEHAMGLDGRWLGLMIAAESGGVASGVIGAGVSLVVVNVMTELQRVVPPETRGAAMGAAQALGGAGLPIGMGLVGPLLDSPVAAGMDWSGAASATLAGAGAAAFVAGIVATRAEARHLAARSERT